jgi:hypothetical protein
VLEVVGHAGFVFDAHVPLAWKDARPVERVRDRLLGGLPDGRHGVLNELAPGHPVFDVGHVKIGIEENDGVAYGVDDV